MKRVSRAAKVHPGNAAVEYALIAGVIGLAMIVTLLGISGKLAAALSELGAMLSW